jgi:hypothetical protein
MMIAAHQSLVLIAALYVASLVAIAGSTGPVFQKAENCLANISSPNYLFHLPTHEGLVSHFNQLETLWLAVTITNINKTIVSTPIVTHHFSNVSGVRLCEIFVFPPEIQCSCESERNVAQIQTYCPVLGSHKSWSSHPGSYGLTANQSALTLDVDLRNVSCVAGMLIGLKYTSLYSKAINENSLRKSLTVKFAQQYVDLATTVSHLLGFHNTSAFLALHWRRGDQLRSRCKSTVSTYKDTSLNCHSVEEFIRSALWAQSQHFQKTKSLLPVYVATNEANSSTIQQLHHAGFLTQRNITDALQSFLQLHDDDIFVVELLLMCNAVSFLHWGTSAVHTLVRKCRRD